MKRKNGRKKSYTYIMKQLQYKVKEKGGIRLARYDKEYSK